MFFSCINLGCSKNLVDMQFLLGRILEQGSDQFFYVSEPFAEEVELVFLNTCGFISSGREEMFQTLKKLLKKKKKVCLLGCAVQYFEKVVGDAHLSDDELQQWYALKSHSGLFFLSWGELAHFDPKSFFSSFHSSLPQKKGQLACSDNGRFGDFERPQHTRAYTNIDLGFEYVKIAEGCNNHCSFCIIPRIRGKQISLPLETVLQEVKNLISQGVKEIILIAQDTARYGIDLYGKSQLFELLEAIDQLTGDFHYRVLYLYPDLLTRNHLERLTKLRKFIPYFDLPLQHASPRILRAMGRFYDHDMTLSLLAFIKEQFPVHFIRTNIIIGFP